MPKYQFINDFTAVVWEEDGVIYCVPTDQLTEQEKELIYREKGY